jgi:hypothetical protein
VLAVTYRPFREPGEGGEAWVRNWLLLPDEHLHHFDGDSLPPPIRQ